MEEPPAEDDTAVEMLARLDEDAETEELAEQDSVLDAVRDAVPEEVDDHDIEVVLELVKELVPVDDAEVVDVEDHVCDAVKELVAELEAVRAAELEAVAEAVAETPTYALKARGDAAAYTASPPCEAVKWHVNGTEDAIRIPVLKVPGRDTPAEYEHTLLLSALNVICTGRPLLAVQVMGRGLFAP